MATYNTPGVFVEEVPKLPASVAPVATAIPAFVGFTKLATETDPVKIGSMAEFESIFGGPKEADLSTTTFTFTTTPTLIFYYCMQHYFANGGGDCYVVSAGDYTSTVTTQSLYTDALAKVELEDEPTLLVVPEARLVGDTTKFGNIVQAMLTQCANLGDRFAILDTYVGTSSINLTNERTYVGNGNMKYGAMYYPNLKTTLTYSDEGVLLDGGNTIAATKLLADPSLYVKNAEDINAAIAANPIVLPPSAAIAGIYARVDRNRGVWKAPANVSINAVSGPKVLMTDTDQENYNIDSATGKSINVIRQFNGRGTLVWGSRTLAGNDNEWRYIPVRRLFLMIEESVNNAMQGVVFEPNTANTWARVRMMIENFLADLWSQGALAGAVKESAFYVNVGLGVTMTSDDILNGKLIVDVGIAAIRPAEFVVLRFSHKLQES